MFTTIKPCIVDEWHNSTTLGKLTWVPLFTLLLITAFLIFLLAIPIVVLVTLLEAPISLCLTGLRKVLFKQRSTRSAQKEE